MVLPPVCLVLLLSRPCHLFPLLLSIPYFRPCLLAFFCFGLFLAFLLSTLVRHTQISLSVPFRTGGPKGFGAGLYFINLHNKRKGKLCGTFLTRLAYQKITATTFSNNSIFEHAQNVLSQEGSPQRSLWPRYLPSGNPGVLSFSHVIWRPSFSTLCVVSSPLSKAERTNGGDERRREQGSHSLSNPLSPHSGKEKASVEIARAICFHSLGFEGHSGSFFLLPSFDTHAHVTVVSVGFRGMIEREKVDLKDEGRSRRRKKVGAEEGRKEHMKGTF